MAYGQSVPTCDPLKLHQQYVKNGQHVKRLLTIYLFLFSVFIVTIQITMLYGYVIK